MLKKFHSHDQSLFEKISKLFSQDVQMYLSDFDFANTGHTSVLDGLFEMDAYANTIDYQFIDADDEFLNIYINLKVTLKKFLHTFAINTTPTGNKMFQVASQKDWDLGDSKQYREEADEINAAAAILFESMKLFVMNGKKRIYIKDVGVHKKMNETYSIREFNELFNQINIKDTDAYLTGPQFFKIVNQFDPAHPDYNQDMEERKKRKLPTSRKTVFKDVLDNLEREIRDAVINHIKTIEHTVSPIITKNPVDIFTSEIKLDHHEDIPSLSENKNLTETEVIVKEDFVHIKEPTLSLKIEDTRPKVFISYSWDDEDHKNWVLKLSSDLRGNGIETILDRYSLSPGKNASHFMENAISEADKVLMIFTENYATKAAKRQGGVGVEYSILNTEICANIVDNEKYIPILRQGTMETSIPPFIRQYIALFMNNDLEYQARIKELVHSIFNKSMIKVPDIGQVPEYIKN